MLRIFLTVITLPLFLGCEERTCDTPHIIDDRSDVTALQDCKQTGSLFIERENLSFMDQLSSDDLKNLDALTKLERINGDLTIQGNVELSNIDGLSNVIEVSGNVLIKDNGLINLDGLSKLEKVGGFLEIINNQRLTNIGQHNDPNRPQNGLAALKMVGRSLAIEGNNALTVFNASRLLSTGNGLTIRWNQSLKSIEGLAALQTVGGHLTIEGNQTLPNLDGLSSLTRVHGQLKVSENRSLTSIESLSNIVQIDDELAINGNTSLCLLESGNAEASTQLKTFLSRFPNNEKRVTNNGPGCDKP